MPERDYSHVPLARKLGIGAGARVSLIGAPDGVQALLGELPDGVDIATQARAGTDVAVLFRTQARGLAPAFARVAGTLTPAGGLWVAWPKRSSGVATDVDFDLVQRTGLAAGRVDNKVCSIDPTWTAVRFVVRRRDRTA
jgi:hypothetical protein